MMMTNRVHCNIYHFEKKKSFFLDIFYRSYVNNFPRGSNGFSFPLQEYYVLYFKSIHMYINNSVLFFKDRFIKM